MTAPRSQQSHAGELGALTRWALTADRTAATAPARAAFLARFERQVDPEGVLPPAEREYRARLLMRAHMKRLVLQRHARRRKAAETAA